MRCYRAKRWLSAYLDDELVLRRRAALETHIEGCEACSAELAKITKGGEALDAAQNERVPPLPPSLWPQVLASLDEAERLPWHRRNQARLLQAACVAACVVMGFVGGALLSWNQPSAESAPGGPMSERMMVAEAFDVTAFGLAGGKEGLLQCVPK